MVNERDYLAAKKVINDYESQLKITQAEQRKKIETEQEKREQDCGEHYFLPSGGKWSPEGQMSCQFCGKTIGK